MTYPAHRARRSDRRWARRIGLLGALVLASGLLPTCLDQAGPGVALTVDFADPVAAVPREHIGFTATTFGVDGGPVPRNPRDAATLARLGAGAVRIHLREGPSGTVVSGAEGGATEIPAVEWLQTYTRMGLQPTVVLDLDRDGALTVQRQMRQAGFRVHRFVLGNELDANSRSDVPAAEYVRRFREIAAALRAEDPEAQVGGPATAHFEGLTDELVRGLLSGPQAGRASFLDYHAYGAGEGERASMASSWRYGEQLDQLRARIDDPRVGLQVGEFNMSWAADDPDSNGQAQAVWVASALGTILSRGAVAFQYGDKNEAMGLSADGRPKAGYRGLAAFTGGGEFPPFGTTAVRATSSDPAIRVFASTDEATAVVVNTGPATPARLRWSGIGGGRVAVWQDAGTGFSPRGQVATGTSIELALPALSITVLQLPGSRHN